jgi:acyl-coenzyme A thioesterase PaaI-like protein
MGAAIEEGEDVTDQRSFQEQMVETYCWGCGAGNHRGLQIKSYWDGDESVMTFMPQEYHAAGPRHVVNGGIIATLIDCHATCTAIAAAYRAEGRPMDSEPPIWYATGSLQVTYLRPTPIDKPITVRARIAEVNGRKMALRCTASAGGIECAAGEVLAVRVPDDWRGA